MIDIAKAKMNPSSVFATPQDVVNNAELSYADKIAILHQWKYDAPELEVAEEENMAGGEPNLMNRISLALHDLKKQKESHRKH